MWDFLKRFTTSEPEPAQQKMVVRPIVIAENESEHERIRQGLYRLDAIKRYLEQAGPIPERKRREFLVETVTRTDYLYQAGAINKQQHDEFIERVNLAPVSDRA